MRTRSGIALLATLLGILVIEILMASTFHLAVTQLRIARARTRTAQLDAAVLNVVGSTLDGWAQLQPDTLPVGGTAVINTVGELGIQGAMRIEHARAGLFVLLAAATLPGGERREVAVLLRTAATADFLAALTPAASAARALGAGNVTAACGGESLLLLADTMGGRALGPDDLRQELPPPPFVVAGVDLRVLAERLPGGAVALAPALTGGECDGAVTSNWGAPTPDHPCAAFRPMRVFDGDVVMESGYGQGILIATGNITLAPGVRFDGVILAGGTLWLQSGALLAGSARAGDSLVLHGAELRSDPCALQAALAANPSLRGPFRAGAHWWVPLS